MVGTRWFIWYPIECNLLWIDNILTPSSIDLAKVVGWKLRFPIASGYRSLILGKSGVFPTTYASTNSQANQVFMTSNGNPNLAVEPDLSTLYLSQIHQTQRNFPGKQWIQCVVTSCKLKGHVLTMTVIDTPMFTKYITIYNILSLTAFKRVKCSWVSWFHTALYLVQPDCRDVGRLFALRPTELLLFPSPSVELSGKCIARLLLLDKRRHSSSNEPWEEIWLLKHPNFTGSTKFCNFGNGVSVNTR